MTKPFLTQWIEALESNRYVQHYGGLFGFSPMCACAAGVGMIELSEQGKLELGTVQCRGWRMRKIVLGGLEYALDTLELESGLTTNMVNRLMDLNDRERESFHNIAQYMRTWAAEMDEITSAGATS